MIPKNSVEMTGLVHDTLIEMGVNRDEFYYVGPESDDEFTIEVYSGPLGRMVIEVYCNMDIDICTESDEFLARIKEICPGEINS